MLINKFPFSHVVKITFVSLLTILISVVTIGIGRYCRHFPNFPNFFFCFQYIFECQDHYTPGGESFILQFLPRGFSLKLCVCDGNKKKKQSQKVCEKFA